MKRIVLVWTALTAATLASWALGHGHGQSGQGAVAVTIVVIAVVKARLIGLHFMELNHAPTVTRAMFESYCAVLAVLLLGFYLAA